MISKDKVPEGDTVVWASNGLQSAGRYFRFGVGFCRDIVGDG